MLYGTRGGCVVWGFVLGVAGILLPREGALLGFAAY